MSFAVESDNGNSHRPRVWSDALEADVTLDMETGPYPEGKVKLVIVREFVYTFDWIVKSRIAVKKEELGWRRIIRQKV